MWVGWDPGVIFCCPKFVIICRSENMVGQQFCPRTSFSNKQIQLLFVQSESPISFLIGPEVVPQMRFLHCDSSKWYRFKPIFESWFSLKKIPKVNLGTLDRYENVNFLCGKFDSQTQLSSSTLLVLKYRGREMFGAWCLFICLYLSLILPQSIHTYIYQITLIPLP